jgi:hypothetical protein
MSPIAIFTFILPPTPTSGSGLGSTSCRVADLRKMASNARRILYVNSQKWTFGFKVKHLKTQSIPKKVNCLCTKTHNLHFHAVVLAYPLISGSHKEQYVSWCLKCSSIIIKEYMVWYHAAWQKFCNVLKKPAASFLMVEDKGSTLLWNVSNFYQITWFHSQKFIILHHFLCYHDHITIWMQHITIYTCAAQNYLGISLAYSTQLSKQNNYIQIAAFWDVMSCGLVGMYGHFRQTWGNRYLY